MNPIAQPFPVAPAVGEVIVRTEQLTKRFSTRLAVNRLTLDVRRGDVFGLLGPNGAGKSTTLRMLLGLTWPTSGSIWLFGAPTDTDVARRSALRRVGSIIEQPSFYPYLTGRENLRGVGVYAGIEDEHTLRLRIEEALFHVGLAPRGNDTYRTYSLGLKQRLGVAAALLTNPELIILDEPSNGLDPSGMVEMRLLIQHLAEQGMTVILSSHLLHEVQQVCTRVAILREGAIVAQGAVSELLAAGRGIVLGFDHPERSLQAVQVLQEAAANGASWLHGAQYVRPEPGAWVPPGGWLLLVQAPFERAAEVAYLLAARGIYPMEMRQREGSLEELFLSLTGAAPAQAPQPTQPTQPAQLSQSVQYAQPPQPTPPAQPVSPQYTPPHPPLEPALAPQPAAPAAAQAERPFIVVPSTVPGAATASRETASQETASQETASQEAGIAPAQTQLSRPTPLRAPTAVSSPEAPPAPRDPSLPSTEQAVAPDASTPPAPASNGAAPAGPIPAPASAPTPTIPLAHRADAPSTPTAPAGGDE
ncbi:MAG TPA: ATP-binding cassette domain-containing protein [Ktedonobacterales bacterium]